MVDPFEHTHYLPISISFIDSTTQLLGIPVAGTGSGDTIDDDKGVVGAGQDIKTPTCEQDVANRDASPCKTRGQSNTKRKVLELEQTPIHRHCL